MIVVVPLEVLEKFLLNKLIETKDLLYRIYSNFLKLNIVVQIVQYELYDAVEFH